MSEKTSNQISNNMEAPIMNEQQKMEINLVPLKKQIIGLSDARINLLKENKEIKEENKELHEENKQIKRKTEILRTEYDAMVAENLPMKNEIIELREKLIRSNDIKNKLLKENREISQENETLKSKNETMITQTQMSLVCEMLRKKTELHISHYIKDHNSLVFDVWENKIKNYSKIVLYEKNGGENQKWDLTPRGEFFSIDLAHTGFALDILGAIVENGSSVILHEFGYGKHQLWRRQIHNDKNNNAAGSGKIQPRYTFHSKDNDNMVLEVRKKSPRELIIGKYQQGKNTRYQLFTLHDC